MVNDKCCMVLVTYQNVTFYHATKVPYFLTELTADSGSNAVSNTNTII